MARKRASEKKQKKPFPWKSAVYIIGLALVIVIVFIFITSIKIPDDSTNQTEGSDKWLFAIDTAEEAVGSKSEYNTGYIPTLVIIDPAGNIAYRGYSVHSKEDLLEYVELIESGNADNLGAAPDFSLETINDETFTLSDNLGKTVIIDLMAVRCPPCKTQMPELQELNMEKGDSIIIISIDVDGIYGMEDEEDVINAFSDYILR